MPYDNVRNVLKKIFATYTKGTTCQDLVGKNIPRCSLSQRGQSFFGWIIITKV